MSARADGYSLVTRNQETNGGAWVSLGTFNFNVARYSVRLTDNANEIVIADAIRTVSVATWPLANASVPAAKFVPPRTDDVVRYDSTSGLRNYAGHTLDSCIAPLELPNGSIITRVPFYYYDYDVGSFQFYVTQATQGGSQSVPVSTPVGMPGSTYVSTVNAPFRIDNSNYVYYLEIVFPYSSTYNYNFYYAIVEYAVPP